MATYLWKKPHGKWYFRWRIPARYQPYFNNQNELRRSLHTSDKLYAKRRARACMVEIDTALDHIDHMGKKSLKTTLTIFMDGSLKVTPEEVKDLGIDKIRALREMAIETPQSDPGASAGTQHSSLNSQGMPLSQAIDDMAKDSAWTEALEKQYRASVALLIEVVGDKAVNTVRKDDVRQFRDTLKRLPRNRNQP